MGKIVLFSPIGNTDPIRDCYDGGMLHICRHYKPDVVYLYLSKEMTEHNDRDNRYVKTLKLLEDKIGHKFDIKIIRRPDLSDPHLFDAFYSDFEKLLNDIAKDNTTEILLNISSGTPAMKGALQTIAAMSNNLYIPIQVASPANSSNKSQANHDDFDVYLSWEQNIDNTPEAVSRCSRSNVENLNAKIKKEILFAQIDSYDYNAALCIAQSMGGFITQKSITMLEAARARLAMEFPEAGRKLRDLKLQFFERIPEDEKLLESILWLQIKEKRGEYVDFIRGITPVVTELFKACLKNSCNINIDNYCVVRETKSNNKSQSNYLKRDILQTEAPYLLKILDDYYKKRVSPIHI
jgi:CRISPR type III-A/MTUBE-associated protein Csm6